MLRHTQAMVRLNRKSTNRDPSQSSGSVRIAAVLAGADSAGRGGSRASSEQAGRQANSADMQDLEARMRALEATEIRTDEQEAELEELKRQRNELQQAGADRLLHAVQQGAAIAQQPQLAAQRSAGGAPSRSPSPRARSPADGTTVSDNADDDLGEGTDEERPMRQPSPTRLYQLRILRMRRIAAFRRMYAQNAAALRAASAQVLVADVVAQLQSHIFQAPNGVPLTEERQAINAIINVLTTVGPGIQTLFTTSELLMKNVQAQGGVVQDLEKRVKITEAEGLASKAHANAMGEQVASVISELQRMQSALGQTGQRWAWQKSFNVVVSKAIDDLVRSLSQLITAPDEVQHDIQHTPLQPFAADRAMPLPSLDTPLVRLCESTGMDVDAVSGSALRNGGDGAEEGDQRNAAPAAPAAPAATGNPPLDAIAKLLHTVVERLNERDDRYTNHREDRVSPDAQVGESGGEAGGGQGKGPRMKAPKTFTGETDSYELDEALYCFESYCKGSDLPRHKWAMHCANFLGGAALTAYITTAKSLQAEKGPDATPTWEQFQECLQLFAKPEARLRAQRELFELRQTGTVAEYARKFKLLVARSGNKSAPEDLIYMFHKGLKDPASADKDPATRKWWAKLDDLIECVVQSELTHALRRPSGTAEKGKPTFNRFRVRGGVSKLKAAMVPAQGRKRFGGKPQPGQDTKKFRGNNNNNRGTGDASGREPAEDCAVCEALNKATTRHPGGTKKCHHWSILREEKPAVYNEMAQRHGRDLAKDKHHKSN